MTIRIQGPGYQFRAQVNTAATRVAARRFIQRVVASGNNPLTVSIRQGEAFGLTTVRKLRASAALAMLGKGVHSGCA